MLIQVYAVKLRLSCSRTDQSGRTRKDK